MPPPDSIQPSSEPLGDMPEALRSKLEELEASLTEMERSMSDPDVLADHKASTALAIRKAALEPVVAGFREFRDLCAESAELRAALTSDDAELAEIARVELPEIERRATQTLERVKAELVQSDDRRVGSVILEVRAGTGGDEAGLWARDLLDVYTRYAQSKGWKVEELDLTADPSVGGVRHAVVTVTGEGVWSELSFEAGVHSVKRVPATGTQGRIHTSTCTVAVLPEPEDVDVTIDWAGDVQEHITTAQGPGGQNVNKVATAVHLVHTPTGVEVRMQETKSQAQNREKARRLLTARVYEIERARAEAERAADRKAQIGTGQRSEKIRVYRYQDNIVADERLSEKFQKTRIIDQAELGPLFAALLEQQTAKRLAAL